MSETRPKTGGEIDSYCTKCRLDLNHRIVAMIGDTVKKVECLTCRTQHLYRVPKSLRDAERSKKSGSRTRAPAKPKAPSPGAEKQMWETAIAGRAPDDFTPYRITEVFQQGQLIRHKKFGDGVVRTILDPAKVEILFEDGAKTMAQGQQL